MDLIEIAGFEASIAGYAERDFVGTWVLLAKALAKLRTPVVVSGSTCTGRQLAAALAMGAAGVVMGTRFLATQECPIMPALKTHLASPAVDEYSTAVVLHSLGNGTRVYRNGVAKSAPARFRPASARARAHPPSLSGALRRFSADTDAITRMRACRHTGARGEGGARLRQVQGPRERRAHQGHVGGDGRPPGRHVVSRSGRGARRGRSHVRGARRARGARGRGVPPRRGSLRRAHEGAALTPAPCQAGAPLRGYRTGRAPPLVTRRRHARACLPACQAGGGALVWSRAHNPNPIVQ